MSIVVDGLPADVPAVTSAPSAIRIALLGVGQVGGAVAARVRTTPLANQFTITSGLVRDVTRDRPNRAHVRLTCDPTSALRDRPDIVIEALGGIEPARTLVLRAIESGTPVVTANKSLLAAHGDELLSAAARYGVALRYEAAVLAGVPFLGTFSRRPLARDLTGLSGIVNGTTNFILSNMSAAGTDFASALFEAQRRGYAEPDPSNDINGTDAVEKLCVLLRHFRGWSISPSQIERAGIDSLSAADLYAASELGGVIKPVVSADWADDGCSAFAGPAFVPASHPLSRIDGVQNAVLLRNGVHGPLLFAGPGAGPSVTAATLLDDAIEIVEERTTARAVARLGEPRHVATRPALTKWFVRIRGNIGSEVLAACGVGATRTVRTGDQRDGWFLTGPCERRQITHALAELEAAGCRAVALRALD